MLNNGNDIKGFFVLSILFNVYFDCLYFLSRISVVHYFSVRFSFCLYKLTSILIGTLCEKIISYLLHTGLKLHSSYESCDYFKNNFQPSMNYFKIIY